ncbi:MAG: hypothetical protein VCA35_05435 [Roseibacillus sp.]
MCPTPGGVEVGLESGGGALGEDGHTLREGLRLEVEPDVGANDYIIDMRVFLECRGAVGVSLGTGFSVGSGKPIVLRLGRAKGKNPGGGHGGDHRTEWGVVRATPRVVK